MSKLDLLSVASGDCTLLTPILTSGSYQEARIWEGDTGSIYVYNLKGELWVSIDNGATFSTIFPVAPTVNPPASTETVTAITQYQRQRASSDISTGSLPDTTIIWVTGTLPSTDEATFIYWQEVSSGSKEIAGDWDYNSATDATVIIKDAIEDGSGTAGVLAGNGIANVLPASVMLTPHRIFRSRDMVSAPAYVDEYSDEGLMPTLKSTFFGNTGYQNISGIDIKDLEVATS